MSSDRYAVILAAACGQKSDGVALTTAARLAERFASLVRVAPLLPDPALALADWGGVSGVYLSPEVMEEMTANDRRMVEVVTRDAEATAATAGLAFGPGASGPRMVVDARSVTPWLTLEEVLPLVDLMVVAADAAKTGAFATGPLAEALMAHRAPVLVARNSRSAGAGTIAIAWDGSLEAGRAVRAARPLLVNADKVVILQDPSELDLVEGTATDPARLAEYLSLAGVRTIESARVTGGKEGHVIVAAAQHHRADLLVAGAYGHSRLREWILGGATRAFLDLEAGPDLLIAH